jgi:aminoglycoside phosphotransferase (APT) family kinase protein
MRGIHEARVTEWFTSNINGCVPPFVFTVIAGGHSNLTFKVDDAAGRCYVLRRPPLGHVLASAHDMGREHRLITAIGHSDVPVPKTLGMCTDVSVNDAPFYVMDFVPGVVLDDVEKVADVPEVVRRSIGFDLVDVLADLHRVDVTAIGLADLAKHDGYVARQLKRWSGQWEQSKTRELPVVEQVRDRLLQAVPVQQRVSIAHGDYRLGNCLANVTTGKIAAVLDWELCTLGDPLADLSYVGVYWSDDTYTSGRNGDCTMAGGFPSYRELLARYEARTGLDVSNIRYYQALSAWRLSVISEGVLARYLNGQMAGDDQEAIDNFRAGAEDAANRAMAFLDGER